MATHADLIRLWGDANVVRANRTALEGMAISAEDADVLVEVGLPRQMDSLFVVSEPVMLEAPRESGRYVQFGSDSGTDLCISSSSGEIVSLSLTGEYPDRFINTRLALFVKFLLLVSAERARFPDLGDKEVDQILSDLEKRLILLDPRALADPDNWWSVIMEQLKDGLL